MKYPFINRQPSHSVTIPELSGGANYRDSISNVLDNQLTDCLNVWWQDGALRTRPSFKTNKNMYQWLSQVNEINDETVKVKVFPSIQKSGAGLVCVTALHEMLDAVEKKEQTFTLFWQNENEIVLSQGFTLYNVEKMLEYFIVEKDGTMYLYVENGIIFFAKKEKGLAQGEEWNRLSEEDIYIPIVMTHCQRGSGANYKGVMFEGYNLLNPRFQMIYSAYNNNDTDSTHPMRYHFCCEIAAEGEIKATVTYMVDGSIKTCDHSIDASGLENNIWVYESEPQADGLTMYACKKYFGFGAEKGSNVMPTKCLDNESDVYKYGSSEDNLIVEATSSKGAEKKKVFGMTQSVWFGGSANGISDGSRLFLCGNTNENEQALVVWSGLNNPTYFPENNYAYVGNKSQPANAFGKQDEKLVIFKPNETYYTYYAQNNNITADDLINQSVVDYQANSVYFPMIQLNGAIGCDMPDTVQLCRNRLVWANSNGKVYTLVSTNQYSEMSIYETSQMVERKIKEADYTVAQFNAAQSCDFAGHYVLIIGQDAYVMDYNSYGYQYVYGHLKNEDANIKIPWYVWKMPSEMAACFDKKIFCYRVITKDVTERVDVYLTVTTLINSNTDVIDQFIDCATTEVIVDENGESDVKTTISIATAPIKSTVTTKFFDFGAPHYRKNVDRVSVTFNNNGGLPIAVRFITDVGTEEEFVSLSGNELTAYTPANVMVKQFSPCIRSHTRFGIQIECDGLLAVDAVNLVYRLLGGVR